MARNKDELKQYAAGIAKEKGLSDAQATIAIAVLTGDNEALKDVSKEDIIAAVGPVADLAVGRHAEWSSAMDTARNNNNAAIALYNKNKKWHDDNAPQHQAALAKAADLQQKVDAYEAEYGSLDETVDLGGGKTVTATGKVLKTDDVDKLKTEIRAQTKSEMAKDFIAFTVEQSRLQKVHFARFKEPLDVEELLGLVAKYADDPVTPRAISLTDAHNELYGEKIAAQDADVRKAELDAAEKRGEERGRKAVAVTIGRTGATIPENSGVLFAHLAAEAKAGEKGLVPMTDDEAAIAFNADFEEALAAAEAATSS